uniref:Uncharacterized protein n=1 Tax=Rhizophora mucronata TaxID=61149 RepID=A0A2P2Q252_RHIMU
MSTLNWHPHGMSHLCSQKTPDTILCNILNVANVLQMAYTENKATHPNKSGKLSKPWLIED